MKIGPLVCTPPEEPYKTSLMLKVDKIEAHLDGLAKLTGLETTFNETLRELRDEIDYVKEDASNNLIQNIQILKSNMQEELQASTAVFDTKFDEEHAKINETLEGFSVKIEEHKGLLKVKGEQFGCPTENTKYRLINDHCYYHHSVEMTYDEAKKLCATKFVGGKLFEPESLAKNNLVWNAYKDYWPAPWIGINEKNSENNFHYDSTGENPPFNQPWHPTYSNRYPNACAVIFKGGKWYDQKCSDTYFVLCEQ